jgi:hypothetical protein
MSVSSMFFKRYTLWLPKAWFLLILLLTFGLILILGFRGVGLFLAQTSPKYAEYLVVEGWQGEQSLQQALLIFNEPTNNYKYLITTGGPNTQWGQKVWSNYADKSAHYFVSHGLAAAKVVSIPTPASAQNRTYLSAVMVRDWFADKSIKVNKLDVFSQGAHARRTRLLYELALPDSNIGVYASEPEGYQLSSWWKTSQGSKAVLTEWIGFIWTICFFEPGAVGSHQEKWGSTSND